MDNHHTAGDFRVTATIKTISSVICAILGYPIIYAVIISNIIFHILESRAIKDELYTDEGDYNDCDVLFPIDGESMYEYLSIIIVTTIYAPMADFNGYYIRYKTFELINAYSAIEMLCDITIRSYMYDYMLSTIAIIIIACLQFVLRYFYNKILKFLYPRFLNPTPMGIDCIICLSEVYTYDYTKFSCNHVYHTECAIEWMKINKSCPICRKSQDDE